MISVLLIFRKRRPSANFSIEASFAEMLRAFDGGGRIALREFVSTYISSGFSKRVLAMLEVWRQSADVYHITGDVHFLCFALPRQKTVLTVHDVGFLNRGTNRLFKWMLKKLWLDWPVRHCRAVTAVSEATRREIIRHSGCPPEKVQVIPTIISSSYQAAPKPFNQECPKVLHIGMAPNKNFMRHVEALAGLRCKLQIIGRLSPEHLAQLEKHGIDYVAGHDLPNEAVQEAYRNCDVVLFASTLEGFGMPIIEGNTVGRVVVTSNLSSMPEVAGDSACLVDPYDVASIRAGLLRVIEDAPYRERLIEAGFVNRLRFTPEVVAARYRELYAGIAGIELPDSGTARDSREA